MSLCSIALILFIVSGLIEELQSHSYRHRRSRCKSHKEIRHSVDVMHPTDSMDVIWSDDGKLGVKHFESNGRKYTEIHELVPIPGGRYHNLVKKVVESTTSSALPPALSWPDRSSDYNDVIWYEPPGQKSYPRLLFSSRFGWREMNADEIRKLHHILPIAEYGSVGRHSNRNPSNRLHKINRKTDQSGQQYTENQQNIIHTDSRSHYQGDNTLKRKDVKKNEKTWIFHEGSWYYTNAEDVINPGPTENHSVYNPRSDNEKTSNFRSIFRNGSLYQKSQLQSEKYTQELQANELNDETLYKNVELSRPKNDFRLLKNDVTVDNGLGKSRYNKENDTDDGNSYARRYHENIGVEEKQFKILKPQKDIGAVDNQITHKYDVFAQQVQEKNRVTVDNTDDGDDDRRQFREELNYVKKRDEAVLAHRLSGSHVIDPNILGTNDAEQPAYSNDSQHNNRDHHTRIQILDDQKAYRCSRTETIEESKEFWLLRKFPCDENSIEGLILLPNGEKFKFYGHPLLASIELE